MSFADSFLNHTANINPIDFGVEIFILANMKIIGITGISGGGKTSAAQKLKDHYGDDAIIISLDCYYFGRDPGQSFKEYVENTNFDHPDAIDFALFVEHLKKLKNGETVFIPSYDMSTSLRTDNVTEVKPAKILIIEGILILSHEALRKIIDVTVYIATSSGVALARRIERDKKVRKLEPSHTLDVYEKNIWPTYLAFIKPWKNLTDVKIQNSTTEPLDITPVITKVGAVSILSEVSQLAISSTVFGATTMQLRVSASSHGCIEMNGNESIPGNI